MGAEMITAYPAPAGRRNVKAAYNRRRAELLAAQKEIARLCDRVRNLQIENQMLSYRLAEKEAKQ